MDASSIPWVQDSCLVQGSGTLLKPSTITARKKYDFFEVLFE